jgi:hypothetical protein
MRPVHRLTKFPLDIFSTFPKVSFHCGRRFPPDLGDRDLHRRPLADDVEPACEVGVVLPYHTLDVVIARPRECCDVGDSVFVAR